MTYLARFDEFHLTATESTGGLRDFGSTDYEEPLRLLLADYDRYARFSPEGAEFAAGDIIANLVGRLREQAGFEAHPEYVKGPVEQPLFIIGMPRTGTTMLHRLLSLDEQFQTLPLWLAMSPMPRPPRSAWDTHPAFIQAKQGLEHIHEQTPLLKAMHPQSPEEPDECRVVLNHSFWSPGMMTSFADVPNYGRWVFETDALSAYQRYRAVLGLIAGGRSKPWLLKDPDHVFQLATLIKVFPSARLVFTHRDPVEAVTSFGNIMYHARSLVEPDLEPEQLSRVNLPGYWAKAMHKMEQARKDINPAQMLDLHLDEINADPLAAVARIYDYFGIEKSTSALDAMRLWIHDDPRAGHGNGRRYSLAALGTSPEEIREAIGDYWQRYQSLTRLVAE